MSRASQPLVSVVTPVFNGEPYLVECVESVIAQTYSNWELLIVDNCSTDGTLEIARGYQKREARVHVYRNSECVSLMRNHNIAFAHISPDSTYCKILHADDWLFPECLARMVDVAERHPSVGLVGSYCLYDREVRCDGLPASVAVVPGRELGRKMFLREFYPFLSPSSIMVRAEFLRRGQFRYDEAHIHADVEACFQVLQYCDFGFVHQVLTFVRPHRSSMTATVADRLNTYLWSWLDMLRTYGPRYLEGEELERLWREQVRAYYRFLGRNLFRRRAGDFWAYHRGKLQDLGLSLTAGRVLEGLVREALDALSYPVRQFRRAIQPLR
ncbi:MAG: glycosyltransferase family 2 protein [Armatimonadota bacterium]|nr:glycosyltransferase family 2 protein [Armatimonadota bacterium]MDR7531967.1 glycosyltransferase family 2 protein [Armatimonadota bacterium]